jgi:hypothetical protein
MGSVDQRLRNVGLDPWQNRIESCLDQVAAVSDSEIDFDVDGDIRGQADFHFAGDELDCRQIARRPAHREQLLGIGAGSRRAGHGESYVEAAIGGARCTPLAATCRVSFRRVDDFFRLE